MDYKGTIQLNSIQFTLYGAKLQQMPYQGTITASAFLSQHA